VPGHPFHRNIRIEDNTFAFSTGRSFTPHPWLAGFTGNSIVRPDAFKPWHRNPYASR